MGLPETPRYAATRLQVTDIAGPKDSRPIVQETSGPQWGLHVDDINLALGNLVQIVADESVAYTHQAVPTTSTSSR